MFTTNRIFLIESGPALDLVKHHIQERKRVHQACLELLKTLCVREVWRDIRTGIVSAVRLPQGLYPEFTKPDRKGRSWPKKGTEWAAKFKAQIGHQSQVHLISDRFNIPLVIAFDRPDGSFGSTCIGSPLNECGFLYCGEEGPYAMWVPNVPEAVAQKEAEGYTVEEPAKSFNLEFPGCHPILEEEWELIVALHKLAEAQGKAVAA